MNEKYNKEVFQFFTEDEDRFLMMGKIAEHESKVKKELIKSFWKTLEKRLKKQFEAKEGDWVVRTSDNWEFQFNKIVIYRKSWCFNGHGFPLVCVAFESLHENNDPFLGILNRRKFYNEIFDVDLINQKIGKTESLTIFGQDNINTSWAVRRHLNFHLKNYENLANLLPVNAEETISFLIADVELYTAALEKFMKENNNLAAYKL
jgi:hypothetical protein